jgi:hypothetical protein
MHYIPVAPPPPPKQQQSSRILTTPVYSRLLDKHLKTTCAIFLHLGYLLHDNHMPLSFRRGKQAEMSDDVISYYFFRPRFKAVRLVTEII